MTKLTKLVANCETGETTEVELTAEEIADREARVQTWAEQEAARQAEADALASLKARAIAKLTSGQPLTEDEAKVLVP